MTAQCGLSFRKARQDGEFWGRLVESAIGAHLANAAASFRCKLYYWRERSDEVDFVLESGPKLVAIEVKSGRSRQALPGIDAFSKAFKPKRSILIGTGGVPAEDFLLEPVDRWL
jgi:hypothetical protein